MRGSRSCPAWVPVAGFCPGALSLSDPKILMLLAAAGAGAFFLLRKKK
jgi:hypothetical protein